jgi:hypothetical protein
MTTLPEPVKNPLTYPNCLPRSKLCPEAPPDMVTRLRGKLDKLPPWPRAIYPRENLTIRLP